LSPANSKANKTPPPKKQKRRLNIKRLILIIFLILLLAVGGFAFGTVLSTPDFTPGNIDLSMSTLLYDRNGDQFATLSGGENRIWVEFDQMPEDLKNAFLATEDNRFYQHHGVDPIALGRAVLANITQGWGAQGGSTITMQLARTAYLKNWDDTLSRKIQEAVVAIKLERSYTKDEIFEAYLNAVYFGEGANGIQAAAQTYFGKDVADLTLSESALLCGLVKGPEIYNPFKNPEGAIARRNQVLENMVNYGVLDAETAQKAKEEPLNLTERKSLTASYTYPYFVDYVIEQSLALLEQKGADPGILFAGGLNIYTTLDPKVQKAVEEAYAKSNNFPPDMNGEKVESAMAVVDVKTSEIRGLMGGREHITARGFNRAVQPRQPGSAAKPVAVYGAALELGYGPATVIDDVPVSFGDYSPKNYDGRYRGLISIREAIQRSVNVAAVKTLNMIGIENGYQFARKLGLPLEVTDKNLSMALGGWTKGASPLEMACAYASFGNEGIYTAPTAVTKITDQNGNIVVEVIPQQIEAMSQETAFLMTDMLQTVVKSGTGTRAQMNRPVAGKTGTTQLPDNLANKGLKGTKDAWWVGYTPELAAAVWMGFDQTDEKHYLRNVAGGSYPALIFKEVMSKSLEGEPVKSFPSAPNIVKVTIDSKSGLLPSKFTPQEFIKTELFNSKYAPKEVSTIWQEVDICSSTKLLATSYCPNTEKKVVLRRPSPYTSVRPEDAHLEEPKTYCNLHNENTKMIEVVLCTDPRHEGERVIANIPSENETGGCPPELLKKATFAEKEVESLKRCNLPEHALQSTEPQISAPQLKAQLKKRNGGEVYVQLNWKSELTGDKIKYVIQRWSDEQGTEEPSTIAELQEQSYNDTNIKENTKYYYRVLAIDEEKGITIPSPTVIIEVPEN